MRRQSNPLIRAYRRGQLNRDRRSEAGDTLIEILLTVVILGGCAVALITTFGTAISASADYRSLATNATVLRTVEQQTFYQLQQQPGPLFYSCATSNNYTAALIGGVTNPNRIIYSLPTGYSVTIGTVQYWNGSAFVGTCPAGNDPQLLTLTVNNPNGSVATTQIAVDAIGALSTPVTVTAISPSSAATGTASVLLTITGTGFVSGAAVSFPSAASISIPPLSTTFVSPTTLTVFANLSTAVPGDYDVLVTNPSKPAVSSTSPLFTVLAVSFNGIHVSTMSPNIADPVTDDPDEEAANGWDAWDTITVESGSGAPLQGVVINGTWSVATVPGHTLQGNLGSSTTTCTTDQTGTCTVYYGWPDKLNYVTATFTMSTNPSSDPAQGGLVLPGYTYTPGTNNPGSCIISAPIPGNPPAPCG